jgi:serine/arginine repetitive matrix protein 2
LSARNLFTRASTRARPGDPIVTRGLTPGGARAGSRHADSLARRRSRGSRASASSVGPPRVRRRRGRTRAVRAGCPLARRVGSRSPRGRSSRSRSRDAAARPSSSVPRRTRTCSRASSPRLAPRVRRVRDRPRAFVPARRGSSRRPERRRGGRVGRSARRRRRRRRPRSRPRGRHRGGRRRRRFLLGRFLGSLASLRPLRPLRPLSLRSRGRLRGRDVRRGGAGGGVQPRGLPRGDARVARRRRRSGPRHRVRFPGRRRRRGGARRVAEVDRREAAPAPGDARLRALEATARASAGVRPARPRVARATLQVGDRPRVRGGPRVDGRLALARDHRRGRHAPEPRFRVVLQADGGFARAGSDAVVRLELERQRRGEPRVGPAAASADGVLPRGSGG